MRDYDFIKVIGATILAAGIAVMTQDPSFRMSLGPVESESTYRDLMTALKRDPAGDRSKRFKGDLQKYWVRFTDADLSEVDGNYERFQAKIQERYEGRQQEINQWVAAWYKSTGG